MVRPARGGALRASSQEDVLSITASQSARLLQCGWWADKEVEGVGEAGEATRYGSAFHQAIAELLRGNEYPAYAEILEGWRLPASLLEEFTYHVGVSFVALEGWLEDNPWQTNWLQNNKEIEQSYFLNPLTFEVGKCELDEEGHIYNAPAGTIPGTLDLYCEGKWIAEKGQVIENQIHSDELGSVVIYQGNSPPKKQPSLLLDHKTGSAEDFSQPLSKPQLLTLAAMKKMRGRDVIAVLHAPRGGKPIIYAEELPPYFLESYLGELSHAYKRIGDGSMRPGPECKYCPAKSICPAKQGEWQLNAARIVEAAGGAIELARKREGEITLEKRGQLQALASEAIRLANAIKADNRKFVGDNPGLVVKTPDGRALQLVPQETERFSKKRCSKEELQALRDSGALQTTTEMHLKLVDLDE